jgi:hypothetical protein
MRILSATPKIGTFFSGLAEYVELCDAEFRSLVGFVGFWKLFESFYCV